MQGSGLTLQGPGALLNIENRGTLAFNGSQTLGSAGTVEFGPGGTEGGHITAANGVLTIDQHVTIDGGGTGVGSTIAALDERLSVNQGTIQAAQGTITIGGAGK